MSYTLNVDQPHPDEDPRILLMMVCSSWNNLVVHFPSLWSNVIVADTRDLSKGLRQIARAGGGLLQDVFLTVYDTIPHNSPFLSTSNRWRRLHLVIGHPALLNSLAPIHGCLAVLEELTFCTARGTSTQITLFHNTPQLQTLTYSPTDNLPRFIPWTRMTTFAMYNHVFYMLGHTNKPRAIDVVRTLQRMPNLTTCFLHSTTGLLPSDLHLMHQNITQLTISSASDTSLLQHITLPLLQSLILVNYAQSNDIAPFIQRSNGHITHLVLLLPNINNSNVDAILAQSTNVAILEIGRELEQYSEHQFARGVIRRSQGLLKLGVIVVSDTMQSIYTAMFSGVTENIQVKRYCN